MSVAESSRGGAWRGIAALQWKELRDARCNRWFLVFCGMFIALTLALSVVGLSGLGRFGVAGFGRTAASLLNLVQLIVPLIGLMLGALSVSVEREQGTLLTLLVQPVTPAEILLGKFLGTATAMTAAVLAGFGLSAVAIGWFGGLAHVGGYLALVAFTVLLGLGYLAIGFAMSVLAPKGITAVGTALLAWLVFVFLGDLGLMGSDVVLRLTPSQALVLSLGNPGQVFRLAVTAAMQGHLETFGSGALYASTVLGRWLLPTMTAALVLWIVLPLAAALALFQGRRSA